jgi:hypothetical protein
MDKFVHSGKTPGDPPGENGIMLTNKKAILAALFVLTLAAFEYAGPSEAGRVPAKQAANVIGFKEMAETREIGQPTLNPGGKYASYVVAIPDIKSNTQREELFLASTDGQAIRRVGTPPQSSPASLQWFPDGRRFVFMLRIAGKAQIYSGDTDTAQATPVTHLAGGVDEYALSPDGRRG